MDTDTTDGLDELRAEVEELRQVSEDTNRVVHKMRRGIWWGRIWNLAMWIVFFGISGAAYLYYVQPLVTKAQQYYLHFQQQAGQAQSWEQQASEFFKQLFTPPSSPSVPPSGQ
jgi:hypothetical protein